MTNGSSSQKWKNGLKVWTHASHPYEKEYCVATKNNTATVDLLAKPPNVHPDFQSLTKDQLTKYKVPQLEDKTKQQITAYLTQEETSKEIVRWMVASIEPDYSKDLNNKYTGYNN